MSSWFKPSWFKANWFKANWFAGPTEDPTDPAILAKRGPEDQWNWKNRPAKQLNNLQKRRKY